MPGVKANSSIGSYKILKKIGEGGMAVIYKALQPALKRMVVIKKLKDPNREIVARFKKEALLSASFNQENLVAIYDFLYSGRSYYLIMEYVDGEDLRTIIDYMTPIPPKIAALIVMEIARGLEITHSRNIIHRDIKPSNILISYDGNVKLIDFGVAKDENSTRLTMTGMIVGTPAYMSPEQANGEPLTAQSDLYSLGILLYEMLTGVKPFSGENNTEILTKIIRNKFVRPERINPDIPFGLRRIVKKALRREQNKRYRNASEFIHDLEKFIPWQLRSRKKETIERLISQLNKIESASTDDSLKTAVYSGFQSWGWRLFKYALSGAVIYIMLFLYLQFKQHQIGFLKINLPDKNYIVQIDDKRPRQADSAVQIIGPLLKGFHKIKVRDLTNSGTFIGKAPVSPSDTTEVDVQISSSDALPCISVTTIPNDASVLIDGLPLGISPIYNLHLQPGKHKLEIRLNGYHSIHDHTELHSAKNYTLHYILTQK